MKRLLLILAILVACSALYSQSCYKHRTDVANSSFNSAKNVCQKAETFVANGDNKKAVAQYNEALAAYNKAKDYYQSALECVDAPSNTSDVKKRLDNTKKAIRDIKNILNGLACPDLNVSKKYLTFDSNARNSITIDIEGKDWTYETTGNSTWIEIQKEAKTLTVKCISENESTVSRSCSITVQSCNNQIENINITQEGQKAYLTLSSRSLSFTSDGGQRTVYIETNKGKTVSLQNSVQWLSYNNHGTSATINCLPNKKTQPRDAKISVGSSNGMSDYISVHQDGKEANVPFNYASVRVLTSFDLSVGFQLGYSDNYIEASLGLWNLFRYGARAFGATASFNHLVDFDDFSIYFGGGVGLGAISRSFGAKFGGFIGAEYELPINAPLAVTVDYRPELWISGYGGEGNLLNFTVGAKWYFK